MSVGSQSVVKPAAGLAQPQAKSLSGRLSALGGPLLVLALAIGAAVLFRRELQQHSWVELRGCVLNLGPWVFAAAVLWTAANYAVLVLTDCVAIYSVGSKVGAGRVVLGSFLGYAIGNSLGASVAGTAIRVRLYSRWGMSAAQQIRSIAAVAITFWLGVFALAGAAIAVRPIELPKHLGGEWVGSRAIGLVFVGLVAGYMLFAAVRRRPLHVRSLVLDPPGFRVACAQLAIGLADSLTAAAVLYSLLPEGWHAAGGSGSFLTFLPIYLIAVTAGLMSHVPGGLGVFELVMLWLTPGEADAALLSSLLAYRVLYYLAPLAIGMAMMTVLEFAAVRKRVSPVVAVGRVWLNWLSPRLITAGVFCAGLVLLASGSWPTVDQRLAILCEALPLGAIEASHFFASVVGVVLLLLARGLQRRIDAAYWATLAMLGLGAVASLAKGLDYEESILLLLIAAALAPSHKYFFRQGKLFQPDLNWHWWAAIGGSIGCAVWLTMFAYQGVEYRRELWWEFAFDSDAPRSLRALAGASAVVVVAAVLNALRPVRCLPAEPTEEQLRRASEIVGDSPRASAALALLGDKRFVFSDDQQAFVMFGVEGRTWVAMGDAVGPKASAASAAWNFREMCRHRHVWPSFYQVDESNLGLYVDMGMRLFKLGEEAVVPLEEFSLEGPKRRDLRYTNKKVGQSGCRLEVVRAADVEARMDDLQEISDAWMAGRAGTEKGFSLGCFDPDYLRHFDVAMVYVGDEPIAFANVWQGAQREEYSIDLMRFKPDRVYGVMEWMFIQLMLHAKAEGYRWFNLGMAPLSGIESYEGSPLWNKLSSLAFRHGEHFYNFQGLRHYKSKFDPQWRPKYLASPPGLASPMVLANIATLISGGLSRIVPSPRKPATRPPRLKLPTLKDRAA